MSGEFGVTREDLAAGRAAARFAGVARAYVSWHHVDLFDRGQLV